MNRETTEQSRRRKGIFAHLLSRAALALLVTAVPQPGGAVPQGGAPQQLTLLTVDTPILSRKVVPALTSGNKFADLSIPAAAPIARQGKRIPLSALKPGSLLVCRGNWTDATRSTFRAVSVTVSGIVPPGILRDRIAAACGQLNGRTRPGAPNAATAARPTRPPVPGSARIVSALDGFVMESAKLERDDDALPRAGTEDYPYYAQGVLRNISGLAYDRLEVQFSVLDRDGKKIADQHLILVNVQPGDRLTFRATPPVYLAYRMGQTVRIEKITGTVRTE
jgi:hypothetical protein